jgi:hypothetical protein
MSYEVHNFRTGDIIEAQPVNEMDAQIAQNAQDIASKIDSSTKGVANGVAELDGAGKVPRAQLPIAVTDDNNGNVTLNF